MLFELRMYHSAAGRLGDIVNRMRDDLPPMLRKHGFPWPLGQWTVLAGPHMPMYVWMLKWESIDQRSRCFGSLYADPEWDKVRVRTNGPRDTVVRQDILFMRKLGAFESLRELHRDAPATVDGLYELRLQRVRYGHLPQADRALRETDLPALARCGGRVQGVFEVMSGAPVFTAATFLCWDSLEQRERGLAAFEAEPDVRAARMREVEAINDHLLQGFDCFLLRPTSFGVPAPAFGEFPG